MSKVQRLNENEIAAMKLNLHSSITPSRYELDQQMIDKLHSSSSTIDEKRSACRDLKNALIGHRCRKRAAMQHDLHVLLIKLIDANVAVNDESSPSLLVEACACIGALANENYDHASILIDSGAGASLFSVMGTHTFSNNAKLFRTASRALRQVLNTGVPYKSMRKEMENAFDALVSVVETSEDSVVSEICTTIMARCIERDQSVLTDTNFPHLIACLSAKLLNPKTPSIVICAVLDLLGALFMLEVSFDVQAALFEPSACASLLGRLFDLLSDSDERCRVYAALLLVDYVRARPEVRREQRVRGTLLNTLVRAVGGAKRVNQVALRALDVLIGDSPELQMLACGAGLPTPLKQVILSMREAAPTDVAVRRLAAALCCMASLCARREQIRVQCADTQLVAYVATLCTHDDAQVSVAAARLMRAWSRSVSTLRNVMAVANVEQPLLSALESGNAIGDERTRDVLRTMVSGAICNLVLEFSPMRDAILARDGVRRFATLALESSGGLRLNSVWALKNIAYEASVAVKRDVLAALPLDSILKLTCVDDLEVRAQALALVRNLAYGDVDEIFSSLEMVASVLDAIGENVKNVRCEEVLSQALYCLVNLGTGRAEMRVAIANTSYLSETLSYLDSDAQSLVLPTLWIVSNLLKRDTLLRERFDAMARLDVLARLEALLSGGVKRGSYINERLKSAINAYKNASAYIEGSQESGADSTDASAAPATGDGNGEQEEGGGDEGGDGAGQSSDSRVGSMHIIFRY